MKSQEIKQIREQAKKNISKNLRKYRAEQDITQYKLAKAVGLCPSVLARIENGQRKALAEELPLFAKALGVSINELLSD